MNTKLHIGEVANLLGITPKTIRHYHKVGLLAEPQRTESGYRLYTAGDLLRLQRIRRLQALGLSLKQIKTLLGEQIAGQERSLREGLQVMIQYVAEHPGFYQQMLSFGERLAALAALPEDAPEVDLLIADALTSEEMSTFLSMQSELSIRIPQIASPFADVLSELSNETLSPAQKRFLEAMNRKQSESTKREER
jgi:DNA-binding transcriptional MerR regulator